MGEPQPRFAGVPALPRGRAGLAAGAIIAAMNAPHEPVLLSALCRLVEGDAPPAFAGHAFACITARREHGVKSVQVERGQLAVVLRGTKTVRYGSSVLHYAPGDVLVMAAGHRLDVVNTPDAADGRYLTVALPLCDEVLASARMLWGPLVPQASSPVGKVAAAQVEREMTGWFDALASGREAGARLALTALTLRLCELGHTALLVPPAATIGARVRSLVAQAPQRDWRSADFEQDLGMSGATLRRRLAEEGTRLREVVSDARLACALDLLYTTRWPIKTVADKVGYQSAASFVQRFKERYGLEPARIGNSAEAPGR
jgi:AraC-like DNA-binding protein